MTKSLTEQIYVSFEPSELICKSNKDLKIDKLEQQLAEAIEIVKMYWEEESNQESREFLEKWGYEHD